MCRMPLAGDLLMKRREFIFLVVGVAPALSAAHAQAKAARVGFLALDPDGEAAQFTEALREVGYVEGRNLSFEHRSADGDPARLAALADELVRAKPDVLV